MEGVELYQEAAKDKDMLEKYGKGTPDDWIERNLYTPLSTLGVVILLFVNVALFGLPGLAIWALQMALMPFCAAGVINGLGHWWGYRNFDTSDTATNLTPWGLLIGGEELHNNHHAFPSSAKFALRRFEVRHRLGACCGRCRSCAWPRCCAWRRNSTCARTSRCRMPKRCTR